MFHLKQEEEKMNTISIAPARSQKYEIYTQLKKIHTFKRVLGGRLCHDG
jgi:hypothetical protein